MMTRLPFIVVAPLFVLAMLLIAGCTPKEYAVIYTSAPTLNVDNATKQSRPVHVLVFLLKADGKAPFEEASDEELWTNTSDKVKENLVGDVYEFDVEPGAETAVARKLGNDGVVDEAEISHVGVFAQFTTIPEGGKRRELMTLEQLRKARFTFKGSSITVEYTK